MAGPDPDPDPQDPRVLGVIPNPPLERDYAEENPAQSFHTAGEFSRRVSISSQLRSPDELRRDARARASGLIIAFLGSVGMSVGFAITFGWLLSIIPGVIGILTLALTLWVGLPARPSRRPVRGR